MDSTEQQHFTALYRTYLNELTMQGKTPDTIATHMLENGIGTIRREDRSDLPMLSQSHGTNRHDSAEKTPCGLTDLVKGRA